ncbi:hypothetical protein NEOLEDRAFT_1144879 [Neolentinus lepideus HHB14362 ss-1]|uniref:Uncharacterized protein n=1 Tax=Neolentinus lepideus HHB14362 ss-1 TaxID=1314782 RepID=A0A165VK50_9AGAM|nr:hypothetical protein NEOLEDRAFT_1144879 [Neolentinus lepideus HHB14362 ss-1]
MVSIGLATRDTKPNVPQKGAQNSRTVTVPVTVSVTAALVTVTAHTNCQPSLPLQPVTLLTAISTMRRSKRSVPHSVPVETPTETEDSTAEPARKRTRRTPQQIAADKEKQLAEKAAKSAAKEAERLAKEDAKKAEAMARLQAKEELRRAKEAEKREKMELREAEKARKEGEKRLKAAGEQRLIANLEDQIAAEDKAREHTRNRLGEHAVLLKRSDAIADLSEYSKQEARARVLKAKAKAKAKEVPAPLDPSSDINATDADAETSATEQEPEPRPKKSKKVKQSFRDQVKLQRKHLHEDAFDENYEQAPEERASVRYPIGGEPVNDSLGSMYMSPGMQARADDTIKRWNGRSGPQNETLNTWNSPLLSTVRKAQAGVPPFKQVARLVLKPRNTDETASPSVATGAPFIPVVPPGFKSRDAAGMVSHSQFLDAGAAELDSNTDTASEDDNSVVMEDELAEQEAAISSPVKAPGSRPSHAAVIKISKTSLPLEDVSIDLTITPRPVVHRKRPTHSGSVVISEVGDKAGGRSASSKASTAASFNSSKISIKTEPVSDAASFKMSVTDKAVDILDEDSDIVELESDVSGATKVAQGSRKVKATNKDLPYDIGHSNLWLNIFIPAAVRFVSMLVNPWSLEDKELVPFLQAAYNCVFRETFGPYEVQAKDVLYSRVGQKLYEWRNGFGNTAIAVLDSVWCSDPHKYEHHSERIKYAAYQREHWRFIYIDYSNPDRKKWTGALASPLIAQTLAHHYSFVRLAPFIEIDGYEELSERNYKPIGAIALAAAAMERALDLWKGNHVGVNRMTGKTIIKNPVDKYGVEDKRKLQFSVHNQREPTGLYVLSAQKLKPDALQKVIGAAVRVVKMGTSTRRTAKGVTASCPEDDPRAMLVMNDDSD